MLSTASTQKKNDVVQARQTLEPGEKSYFDKLKTKHALKSPNITHGKTEVRNVETVVS